MSRWRLARGITPVHILALVAVLELAINRVAVPGLRPDDGPVPLWHTQLDFLALFLLYFSGTLPVLVIGARCYTAVRQMRGLRDLVAHGALGVAALLAAIPLVTVAPDWLGFPREVAFGVAVIAIVISSFGRDRDLGMQLGMIIIAVPLLVHSVVDIGARYDWPPVGTTTPGAARAAVMALCTAALISPYVFAPRPFARAVTRPVPIVLAMAVAAGGAVIARVAYPGVERAVMRAIGVQLDKTQPDTRLAIYLLGVATLSWTIAACVLAHSEARRQIGLGLLLIVVGGYAFEWPNHYLTPLLGLALIADGGRRVRDEELAAMPLAADTPAIADTAWQAYLTALGSALERTLGDVRTLTMRGEGGLSSSLVVGEAAGRPVRVRIERLDGSVLALDVVVGHDIDELRGATLSMHALPDAPIGPPAQPLFRSGDVAFDQRFRIRGSALAFTKLLDDGLRARIVATLDGWLAYWEREGLRYRVYPGRGAPLDHPIPLSDLALGRPATAERLVAVIELLVEIAERGVDAIAPAEPSELETN